MIIAASLLLLLLFVAFVASGTGWSNVLSSARNDLVFADRNQAYGAYVIRREHHRTMFIALFSSTMLVSALLALPKLLASAPPVLPPDPPTGMDTAIVYITPIEPRIAPPEARPVVRTTAQPDPFNPVATDSVITKEPIDTTAHDPGPIGPITPKGPIGPVGPTGPTVLAPDTAVREGWEASAPEYPGGMEALYKDLGDLVRYPQIDIDAGREGKVHVSFVVTEDGVISDVKVGRGVSATMDAESVRAIRQLKKKWKPGKDEGKDVKVRFSLPINFKLANH